MVMYLLTLIDFMDTGLHNNIALLCVNACCQGSMTPKMLYGNCLLNSWVPLTTVKQMGVLKKGGVYESIVSLHIYKL